VAITDGVIQEVGAGRPPRRALDLGDHILAPGLIDLQINGVGDVDFSSASPADWRRARGELAAHGVTSFCPTIVSAPLTAYNGMLTSVAEAMRDAEAVSPSSTIVGAHLEGPFLGGAPGAHPPELLQSADIGWLTRLLETHPGIVRIVTIAPEADPEFAAIRLLREAGVVVALGHSDASYDLAIAAADAGASLVTHLFNAMSPLHHREPGISGAALDDDRLTPTLIADLVHVHAAALRLAIARKPNVALVSDVVATRHESPPLDAVRLPDGRLAGATALLDRSVANVVSLGIPIERAISMASTVPAAVLGLTDRGTLVEGARADIIAFDPKTMTLSDVWITGDRVGVGAGI
jgi:N-acetylglucosamine-6-phosphate deacetylase